MDLGLLVKLMEARKEKAREVQNEIDELIKGQEASLFKLLKKVKEVSSFQELEQLNTPESIQLRLMALKEREFDGEPIFERIFGKNNLLPIHYLRKGLEVARTVARISQENRFGPRNPEGTGSLVGPGLLLTNYHVISTPEVARVCHAEFDYEWEFNETDIKTPYSFNLQPERFFIASEALDYCLVAVAPKSEEAGKALSVFGTNRLGKSIVSALNAERVNIIQHPNGQPKQIALRENKIIRIEEDYLLYETDTERGSSGALVLNDQWEAVALHQGGSTKKVKGKEVFVANKGMLINRILEDIDKRAKGLNKPQKKLVDELLCKYRISKKKGRYKAPDPGKGAQDQ